MNYQAILFDMDGTLLPMDMHTFTSGYFKLLYKKLIKYHFTPETFEKAMWYGVAAMVKNDGSRSNEEAFWHAFEELTGINPKVINPECMDFYGKEFHEAIAFTGPNPYARKAVELARSKALKVILATNPLFPMVGQETRMSFIGLKAEDFDLVTSYETDTYCKPNPNYYLEVCRRMELDPGQCLMIGNDDEEDMFAATAAGLDCYLVTDCRIPGEERSWEGKMGSFLDLLTFLETL